MHASYLGGIRGDLISDLTVRRDYDPSLFRLSIRNCPSSMPDCHVADFTPVGTECCQVDSCKQPVLPFPNPLRLRGEVRAMIKRLDSHDDLKVVESKDG